jgi:hypothetical protein
MLSPSFAEWVIRSSDLQARHILTEGLGLHPITAAVLMARGLRSRDDAKAVLLHDAAVRPDPFMLPVYSWNGTEGVQLRIRDLRSSQYDEVAIC